MNLDRDTILGLLPCYVCGDLPQGVAAAIGAAVAADPELEAAVAGLRSSRVACQEALLVGIAELDLLQPAGGRPPVAAPPAGGAAGSALGLLGGLGAAALVLVALTGLGAPPRPADLALARAAELGAGPLLDPGADPGAALRAAGATPQLALAPDLSAHGLRLVGVAPIPGPRPGTAAVYERDGQRFVCQMIVAGGAPGTPDALREVGRLQLRGYAGPEGAVVIYDLGGMRCLFSGPLPLDALLELVAAMLGAA
jgi:hypothetical protein